MRILINRVIAGLLASLLCGPLMAQSEAGGTPDLYQVELLVFRNLDQSRTTPEIPRLPEPELQDVLDEQLARLNAEPVPAAPTAAETETAPEELVEPLSIARPLTPAEPRLLQREADRLAKLGAYELVEHIAWVQPLPTIENAEGVPLTELGVDSSRLAGRIKLYQKRYLHLAVEVELNDGISRASGIAPSLFGGQNLPLSEPPPAIADSRRIRLGQLNYFDQPDFGIVATVSKVTNPQATARD